MINIHESLLRFCSRQMKLTEAQKRALKDNQECWSRYTWYSNSKNNCFQKDSIYNVFGSRFGQIVLLKYRGIGTRMIVKIKVLVLEQLRKKGISDLQEAEFYSKVLNSIPPRYKQEFRHQLYD